MSPGEDAAQLRVALLTPCYWPEVRRGAERVVNELAGGLLVRGERPRIVTSHPGAPTRAVEDGVPVIRNWRPPDGRLRRRKFAEYLTHVPFSYLSLRRGDDHVAHAVYEADAQAAIRWSRETGRPAVYTCMGIPTRVGLVERRRRLELTQAAVSGAAATVALSRAAADEFHRTLGAWPEVIYPGVDLDAFHPAARRSPEPTIVCAAGVGEPRKRVKLLVSAFARVRRERPGARLLLDHPGDPALAGPLEGVEGVELRHDFGDRAALARVYGEAWVSALPSVGEAFGLVLAEAMACGTPGVGSDRDGIPEVISSPEVGRLFGGDDEEQLAHALLEALELAEDPDTAAACRARAEEFSSARAVESYLRLYRELCG